MDFIEAVINNDVKLIKPLLEQGLIDPNMSLDGDKISPLHFAAQHNALETAQLLILAGADVNAVTAYTDETPLDIAKLHGHRKMVELLIKYSPETEKCH